MPRRRISVAPLTKEQVLQAQINQLKKQVIQLRQAGTTSMQIIDLLRRPRVEADLVYQNDQVEGEVVWSMRTNRAYVFHDEVWCPISPPVYHVKVYRDDQITAINDEAFIYALSEDMDGLSLFFAEAYVTTTGGAVNVTLRNRTQGLDLTSPAITIDAGEKHSRYAATAVGINTATNEWADEIVIEVNAGGGTMGLGVKMVYI